MLTASIPRRLEAPDFGIETQYKLRLLETKLRNALSLASFPTSIAVSIRAPPQLAQLKGRALRGHEDLVLRGTGVLDGNCKSKP